MNNDHQKIRGKLERELGRRFLDATWKRFTETKDFEEYCEQSLEEDDLLELAEDHLDYAEDVVSENAVREGGPRTKLEGDRPEPEDGYEQKQTKSQSVSPSIRDLLNDRETLHAMVLEEYLAEIATADDALVHFRTDKLGGKQLTPERAFELIRSHAAQALRYEDFKREQIPVVGHAADLMKYEFDVADDSLKRNRATIFVEPPGKTLRRWSPAKRDQRAKAFEFIDEKGQPDSVRIWGGSLLAEVLSLSERLARRFSWQQVQAAWFVLTGDVPALPPVHLRYKMLQEEQFTRGTVTLTIDAWVSAETVERIYRNIQRRIFGGAHNRQPETKSLTLLRFFVEKGLVHSRLTRQERTGLYKSGILQEWDDNNEPFAYQRLVAQPTSNFWRDYDRARQLVPHPRYLPPQEIRSS